MQIFSVNVQLSATYGSNAGNSTVIGFGNNGYGRLIVADNDMMIFPGLDSYGCKIGFLFCFDTDGGNGDLFGIQTNIPAVNNFLRRISH